MLQHSIEYDPGRPAQLQGAGFGQQIELVVEITAIKQPEQRVEPDPNPTLVNGCSLFTYPGWVRGKLNGEDFIAEPLYSIPPGIAVGSFMGILDPAVAKTIVVTGRST